MAFIERLSYRACLARPVGLEDRTGVKFEDYLTGVASEDGNGLALLTNKTNSTN